MDIQGKLFNHNKLLKNRLAAMSNYGEFEFLYKATANSILERLSEVKTDFANAMELGARDGYIASKILQNNSSMRLRACEVSSLYGYNSGELIIIEDVNDASFAENEFDLIISNLNLHNADDLPDSLLKIRKALKRGGLFIGSLFGVDTLTELRNSFYKAGDEHWRVHSFPDVQQMGDLLFRARFVDSVVDREIIKIEYSSPLKLLYDIKNMGQGSALVNGYKGLSKPKLFSDMADAYQEHYSYNDGVVASFDVIYILAWRRDEV